MPGYEALVSKVEMSQYGYWVVTWSVEPGKQMAVMVCKVGITREQAIEAAAGTLTSQTGRTIRR